MPMMMLSVMLLSVMLSMLFTLLSVVNGIVELLVELTEFMMWHIEPLGASMMSFLCVPPLCSMVSSLLGFIHIWHLVAFQGLYFTWVSALKIADALVDILSGFTNLVVACFRAIWSRIVFRE